MKRYMIYFPGDGDWITAVVELQAFGKPQSDQKHLVTLASESPILDIQETLAKEGKHFVLATLDGAVGYNVSGDLVAAMSAIEF